MNELRVFRNGEFGELDVLEIDGTPFFAASRCANMLGYMNPNKAIKDHCRYVTKRKVPHPQNARKQIEMNFIPEGDLYRLIVHSRLPAAERFERWVFEEVLPSIRRTGAYAPDIQSIVRAAVEAAVSEALRAAPLQTRKKRRVSGAIVGIIANLDAPLRQEVDLMLASRKYTYKDISKALADEYGIHASKSSVARYAKQISEANFTEIGIPEKVYIDSVEEHRPTFR